MKKANCQTCNKEFSFHSSNQPGKYCSRECHHKSMEGVYKLNAGSVKKGDKGSKSIAWKGGRNITSDGYVQIYKPEHPNCDVNNYMLEHRLIVEKYISRYLKLEEIVHHINEITQDNRLANLYIFPGTGKHMRYHNSKNKPKLRSNLKTYK